MWSNRTFMCCVIGEFDDLNFYRQVTRVLGALEYLFKPLHAGHGRAPLRPSDPEPRAVAEAVQGGRVVTVTGVRGGVGASTIAVNLAWHFGVERGAIRCCSTRTCIAAPRPCCSIAKSGPGLRTALETPDRIDELFVERSAQPVTDRLHVLAGEENIAKSVNYEPEPPRRG